MMQHLTFSEVIDRLRAGDETVVRWFVRQYEPEIRRLIRIRLNGSVLRRTMDSVDICQSTFFKFLHQLAACNLHVDTPEELSKLLFTIAQNNFRDELRKSNTIRRGQGVNFVNEQNFLPLIEDPTLNPSQMAANRDFWETVKSRMTAAERALVEQRALGHDWKTLAEQFQSTPAALRRRLVRLRTRLVHALKPDCA
jgi:DNA-directed RNA polymerase specialized sigma24 family protein